MMKYQVFFELELKKTSLYNCIIINGIINVIVYCKIIKDIISMFYKFNIDKIRSDFKDCNINYIKEKYECYNDFYIYLKEKHPSINCECRKTIFRPNWMKYHVNTKYHYNHTLCFINLKTYE